MEKIAFQVLGKDWTLRLLKKRKYKRKNGSDSVAVCVTHKRRIDLGPKGRDLETLIHELVHAFISEMCLGSTVELTAWDVEEIFCELMAKRGQELLNLANDLFLRVRDVSVV